MGLERRARAGSTATRACGPPAWAASSSSTWPAHPDLPVARLRRAPPRPRQIVAANAVARRRHASSRATRRCTRSSSAGFVRGAVVQRADGSAPIEVRAEYIDRRRRRQQPLRAGPRHVPRRASGRTARRSGRTGRSPQHDEPWIESALDVKDRNGNPMPGYGWIFPVGDGTVNIGVGLLSTFRDFKSVNTTHLLDAYAHQIADRWEIDAAAPRGAAGQRADPDGRLGRSEGRARPTSSIGDAAGSVNPFNGEGIDYAYETGAHGRRRAPRGARRRRRRPRCSATRSCSTTSTASTSRSPGCSPG